MYPNAIYSLDLALKLDTITTDWTRVEVPFNRKQ